MILLDLIALDIDPNVVKPGWTPLIITIGMAGVLVLLYLSMRRQFRRIDVNRGQSDEGEQVAGPGQDASAAPTDPPPGSAATAPEPVGTPPGPVGNPPKPDEVQR